MTLKAARINAKKTQTEACRVAKVTPKTLQNWESGRTMPKSDKFFLLCALYGVSPNDIFLGT